MRFIPGIGYGTANYPTRIARRLKVLNAAKGTMPAERWQVLLRIIWKRLCLKDDWNAMNKIGSRSDLVVRGEVKQLVLCRTLALGITDGTYAACGLERVKTDAARSQGQACLVQSHGRKIASVREAQQPTSAIASRTPTYATLSSVTMQIRMRD